jgi:hypothetical protein
MRLLLLCFCLAALPLCAQDSLFRLPRLSIKTNLLTLIYPVKQSCTGGLDYNFAGRWNIEAGGGFFFHSTRSSRLKNEYYQGPRWYAGIKYSVEVNESSNLYLGAMFKYDHIQNRQYDLWLRYGGQYQQYIFTERDIRSHVGLGYFGVQLYSKHNRRWILDVYSGIGRIKRTVKSTGQPIDGEIVERTLFEIEYPDGDRVAVNLQFGFQLGYILMK